MLRIGASDPTGRSSFMVYAEGEIDNKNVKNKCLEGVYGTKIIYGTTSVICNQ